jgi:type I restriction enzyme S subunit
MSSKTKTTATKEEPTPALVPKLRFPEFRDAEGWEQTTLGAVARLKNGYAFKSSEYVDFGPFHIITIANVQQGELSLDATKRIAALPSDIQAHQILSIGDILISMTGNVGRVCRVTCEALLLNQRVGKLIPEAISPNFFYHSVQRDEFRNTMQLKAAGGAQGNLSGGDITEYTLHCPADEPEQQKIAECLSSVDELIAAQARKLDALKTHKKGLMQQLFPREGETQPRLRFPEFQNAGEWVEQKLEDLAKRGSGHTPSKSHPEYYNGGIKWVSLADSKRLDNGLIYETASQISEEGIKNSSAVLHREGTVFISRDAGIGKSAVMGEPMAVSQHFIAWTCKPRLLSNWFLYHLLQNTKPHFERAATGSTIKTIGLQFFIDLVFRVPALPEQQRIADCLNSLDNLITAEIQKLEALKTHKKGLMQQLFPTLEEVDA